MLDNLPRVPDVHGESVDEKIYSDLYIRTSWVDASVALDQIEKVKIIKLGIDRYCDQFSVVFCRLHRGIFEIPFSVVRSLRFKCFQVVVVLKCPVGSASNYRYL